MASPPSRGLLRSPRLLLGATVLAAGCNSIFGIHEGTPRPICADQLMIDDMEDGDNLICKSSGRNGGWYDFGDGTAGADLTPPASAPFKPSRIGDGSRGQSRYAARISGSGFESWGAIMGLALRTINGTDSQPYDVSGLGGITFWMKSNVPVSVAFPTVETSQVAVGGQCRDGPAGTNCDNHLFFQITAPAPGWFKYTVPFNALAQRPGGSAAWNPRSLMNIQFSVPAGAAFDVWVDDVAFYRCAGPECQPSCTDPRFPVSCRAMDGPRSSCQPAGTDCAAVARWCADPLLIDDMEDGNSAICASGAREGGWFVAADGTSADLTPPEGADFRPTMIPGGRGASNYAARITGSGFTGFGALMGFSLRDGNPYDASGVSGLTFWMKSNGAVAVTFPTLETTPPSQGGQCTDTEYLCSNHFAFYITAPSSEWTQYQVPFSALGQNGSFGTWNPSHLLDVDFVAQRNTAFDVWVDDVAFDDCSTSDCLPTCTDPAFPVQCPASALAPAGCRRPGTDCATYIRGCGASNTTVAPPDGLIAAFTGADRGNDIPGDLFAVGGSAPTFTVGGGLHVAVNASPTPATQELVVVDHFQDCADATAFTGVQFSISGSVSGCTLGYLTEDSMHLFDDGAPYGTHGTARAGIRPAFVALTADQITSAPQTVMIPFAAQSGSFPPTPVDAAKVTGVGWAFSIDGSTDATAPPCVADLTITDVRFY